MQPKRFLVYIFAGLVTRLLFGTVAPATTIDIIGTFDFPGGTATLPQKISDQLDLIGTTVIPSGEKAFLYKVRIKKFSPPINAVFDDVKAAATFGRGLNSKRHCCGEYLDGSDGTFHGYTFRSTLMNKLIFTHFDVPAALQTIPLGINNFEDLVGTAVFDDGTQPAFVSLHNVVTTFSVPQATATFAYMLNSSDQIIGYYIDSNGVAHGFMRDSAGVLTFPIDVPGATETRLFGNNDSNWGVGRYTDASGVAHGLFFVTPDDILTYDYPGATYTSINGINKDGIICGYYNDAAGVSHGFVARVNVTQNGRPNMNPPKPRVTPAYALPELPGIATPSL